MESRIMKIMRHTFGQIELTPIGLLILCLNVMVKH